MSLLWFSADPGCGKSVLSSYLIDHHNGSKASGSSICYFFFKADSDEQRDAWHGLSAVLHQLFDSQPQLIEVAQRILGVKGHGLGDLRTLWKMLVASSESSNANPIICFLDGLDECESASRKALIGLISEYFTFSNTSEGLEEGSRKTLKFFVSSRPENSIRNAFDKGIPSNNATGKDRLERVSRKKSYFAMLRFRGEDEAETISKDIELVITDAVDELQDLGLPSDLLHDLEQELVLRADRTFLWVDLIIKLFKEQVEAGVSRHKLDRILKSRDIDMIYASLLESSAHNPRARKMLNIILAAHRPLSVEELSIALAVRPEHKTFQSTDKARRPGPMSFVHVERGLAFPFENHIKSLCGHFVRIIQDKMYLVHQTAREFLLNEESDKVADGSITDEYSEDPDGDFVWKFDSDNYESVSSLIPESGMHDDEVTEVNEPLSFWQNSFSMNDAHAALSEICVTYLWLLGSSSSTPGKDPTRSTQAFLGYAATAWPHHFRQVSSHIQPRDVDYYHGLCHPRFPGFNIWKEAGSIDMTNVRGVGLSADALQDCLIQELGLQIDAENANKLSVHDRIVIEPSTQYLSSNPAASENSYFPIGPDSTGFVTLDHSQTSQWSCGDTKRSPDGA